MNRWCWTERCRMALSWTDLQALKVLAKAGPLGVTEPGMFDHGFTADILADLVRVGLATEAPETIKAHSQTIKSSTCGSRMPGVTRWPPQPDRF
jgi:hypothetical protein